MAERSHRQSLAGRDIGELPAIRDVRAKAKATRDFRFFCEHYFPDTFSIAWSPAHLKIIAKIETAVLEGGLFAVATPRGFGKSSLCEAACLWAVLYGHREFVCLIGSDEGHASDILDSIKLELEENELLEGDFPEVVYPIARLEGIANRCNGQLYHGQRTHITWTQKEIVLPSLKPSGWQSDKRLKQFVRKDGHSLASGGIIKVAGLTGRIRGMKYKRPDGKTLRPSLVLLDDPQTDESARSPSQCASREAIITGAILGLAGPGQKISAMMPCTVIQQGDLADRFLDKERHPEWNAERIKLINTLPTNTSLWEKYAEIRADSFRRGNHGREATEFYRQHRAAMDEGADVTWPQRYNPDELSAVQHAMNLKLQDERAFWAEYQNEPQQAASDGRVELTVNDLRAKICGLDRGIVPAGTRCLTAFIDVHQRVLYHVVVAWSDHFSGSIIDYGTWPPQPVAYFLQDTAPIALESRAKGETLESAITAGLLATAAGILAREWRGESPGAVYRVSRCLIDAGWGQMTDTVYDFCRRCPFSALIYPSHGKYISPNAKTMMEWSRKPGEIIGFNWRIAQSHQRAIRYVIFDANYWKSFTYARLGAAIGSKGCLTIYNAPENEHRLFIDHMLSEYRTEVQARGRTVEEWRQRLSFPDNHYWDCLVGATVAASIEGIAVMQPQEARRPVSFSEMQRAKRQGFR
jgi:hypothetical protein